MKVLGAVVGLVDDEELAVVAAAVVAAVEGELVVGLLLLLVGEKNDHSERRQFTGHGFELHAMVWVNTGQAAPPYAWFTRMARYCRRTPPPHETEH